jgi:hypothetical protein
MTSQQEKLKIESSIVLAGFNGSELLLHFDDSDDSCYLKSISDQSMSAISDRDSIKCIHPFFVNNGVKEKLVICTEDLNAEITRLKLYNLVTFNIPISDMVLSDSCIFCNFSYFINMDLKMSPIMKILALEAFKLREITG